MLGMVSAWLPYYGFRGRSYATAAFQGQSNVPTVIPIDCLLSAHDGQTWQSQLITRVCQARSFH